MNPQDASATVSEIPATTLQNSERHTDRRRVAKMVGRWTIAVALAALSVGGVLRWKATHKAPGIAFESATVDRGNIAAKVSATGTLSALVTVSVGSQVSGRIDKLFVDYGSTVRKGQTVATIDAAFFRAAVDQARANYVAATASADKAEATAIRAQRSYERALELSADGLVSRAEFETAEADLQVAGASVTSAYAGVAQAEAALEQAELNLRYTTILSPIDGVVIARNVDVGQTVAAAFAAPTLLLIAQDLTRMQVDTNVAEADVGRVQAGMPVTFTVDAFPRKAFRGTVRQVRDNAQTIQNVVTYDAVIDVDNSERLLKPGMTASVTFVYATVEHALRLPNAALRFKPDAALLAERRVSTEPVAGNISSENGAAESRTIWVRRDTTALPVPIRIGISDGSFTEILSGDVQEHDEVVLQMGGTSSGEHAK